MLKFNSLFGAEAVILRSLIDTSKRDTFCIFCDDNEDLEKLEAIIKFFIPNYNISKFPSWDTRPYDVISPSRKLVYERLKCISSKNEGSILLTTYESLAQKIAPKKQVQSGIINIKENQKYDFKNVSKVLVDIGYHRMMNAIEIGEFAVRGSIIDIVSEEGIGYRLDFFGDRVESIRKYSTDNQKTIEKVTEVFISSTTEISLNEESISKFIENYTHAFGVEEDIVLESIKNKKTCSGVEQYLPFFYGETSKFIDYMPENTSLLIKQDYKFRVENILDLAFSRYSDRSQNTSKNYKLLKPEELYDFSEEELDKFEKIILSPFEKNSEIFSQSPLDRILLKSKESNIYPIEVLKTEVSKLPNEKIVVCCYSDASTERIQKLLLEYGIAAVKIKSFEDISERYSITTLPLEIGYKVKDIVFISEFELLGHKPSPSKRNKKLSENVFTELQTLNVGELVVHIDHGIGRFEGLEQITVTGVVHDFIRIIYSGGDKLYIPVENLELITRYGMGEDSMLDKLGSIGWQSRKAKLKNRIKLSAEKLLKIAADRNIASVEPINADKQFYETFLKGFQFAETEDQMRSIDDTLSDLSSTKPMDRLICGDVGFGKTEVALRAVASVVSSEGSNQVAVLVPTTLLARQHTKTFAERFADLPIKISQLSKFASKTSIKPTKKAIEEGEVDVVIGTHMLLSKDIKFKNLKLLIIDEEQHFGVAQKERLKELKANCHVLTLSATPIPRTLQMSLFGIKDLSVIATPPINRLPIKTHVIPFDILTLKEAIMREHYRGGRTFIVTPRIAFLDGLIDLMREHVPEVRVIKAHGGMPSEKLDSIMNDFYDGKYEVLVSTSIVESGLDIPFANTMIIDRAEMFGLAQLYQIRGRVGRSGVQAYSYLTHSPEKRLTDNAEKRLGVISSFEDLGSGFSIAAHDMDIRGYGNLLGDEQSGHIKEVGIELYQSMLKEIIEQIKEEAEDTSNNAWSPIINIGISIQIPGHYIPDDSLRINLYRKIASLTDLTELEKFSEEMTDRFGAFPEEVRHLFSIVKIKQLAKDAKIEKIDKGDKAILITFREGEKLNHDAIMKFADLNKDSVKLRPDNKMIINKQVSSDDQLVGLIIKIVSSLI